MTNEAKREDSKAEDAMAAFFQQREQVKERDRFLLDVALKCYKPCIIAPGPKLTRTERYCIAYCARKCVDVQSETEKILEKLLKNNPLRGFPTESTQEKEEKEEENEEEDEEEEEAEEEEENNEEEEDEEDEDDD